MRIIGVLNRSRHCIVVVRRFMLGVCKNYVAVDPALIYM